MLPYQTRGLHFLQYLEDKGTIPNAQQKKTKGGIFDPLTIGGKQVLCSLLNKDSNVTVREENINKAKKSRIQPKNTLVLTPSVDTWRSELKIYEEEQHLRVLYRENGIPHGKINFHSYEVVVSSYSDLKFSDRAIKSIEGRTWHRLVIDKVDSADNDTMTFILKLNVVNKWILGEEGKSIEFNATQQNFLYERLFGSGKNVSLRSKSEVLQAYTLKTGYFRGFGSNLIETIPINLSHEEREPYMEAENWLKEQFRATTQLEGQEQLRSFINLELYIIKLREMGSHLSLRLKKEGNIEEHPRAANKFNDLQENEFCPICQFTGNRIKIITACGHIFCEICWDNWFKSKQRCVSCYRQLNDNEFFTTPFDCPNSKVNALVDHLNITTSSMVVSKFDMLLPWLKNFLEEQGFSVNIITQVMSVEERSEVLKNPTKGVVLANVDMVVSEKLDLSSMDEIYLMEGMKKNVENNVINQLGIDKKRMFKAFRLIVEDSIEGKIVGLNGAKRAEFKEFTQEEIRRILT